MLLVRKIVSMPKEYKTKIKQGAKKPKISKPELVRRVIGEYFDLDFYLIWKEKGELNNGWI